MNAIQAGIAVNMIAVRNPATDEVIGEIACLSAPEINVAVARAAAAQPRWGAMPVSQRLQVLRKFQRLLAQQKDAVASVITREAGKPKVEALSTEILVVLDAVSFLLANVAAFLRPEAVPHANPVMKLKRGWLLRQPYGVVGIISPWNYPFSIPSVQTLAALATGNAVVLKPSELTPFSSLEMQRLLYAAGLDRDLLQLITGDGAAGAALVNANIQKVIFTGSVATGQRVAQAAALRLLPVVLELGGKDPMVVLDDADVEVASSGAVWGAFVNAGQACLSVERCYVHRSLYDAFVAACARTAKQLRIGDGMNPEVDIGPLIHERQVRNVEAHVEDAVSRGARVLTGGTRLLDLGTNFYALTVLADVNHEMRIMREETFGPVLPIMAFDTDDAAVRLANDSEYGLAASVWTRNRARGEALARRNHAGTVMVNDTVSCFGISEAPHGGVKASGIGQTHGRLGLEEMVRIKYVDSDRLPGVKKVWWYGYGAAFARQMEGFLDLQFARGLRRRLRGMLRSAGVLAGRKL